MIFNCELQYLLLKICEDRHSCKEIPNNFQKFTIMDRFLFFYNYNFILLENYILFISCYPFLYIILIVNFLKISLQLWQSYTYNFSLSIAVKIIKINHACLLAKFVTK